MARKIVTCQECVDISGTGMSINDAIKNKCAYYLAGTPISTPNSFIQTFACKLKDNIPHPYTHGQLVYKDDIESSKGEPSIPEDVLTYREIYLHFTSAYVMPSIVVGVQFHGDNESNGAVSSTLGTVTPRPNEWAETIHGVIQSKVSSKSYYFYISLSNPSSVYNGFSYTCYAGSNYNQYSASGPFNWDPSRDPQIGVVDGNGVIYIPGIDPIDFRSTEPLHLFLSIGMAGWGHNYQ